MMVHACSRLHFTKQCIDDVSSRSAGHVPVSAFAELYSVLPACSVAAVHSRSTRLPARSFRQRRYSRFWSRETMV